MSTQLVFPNSRTLPGPAVLKLTRAARRLGRFTTRQLQSRARVSLSFARKFAASYCEEAGFTEGDRLDRKSTLFTLRQALEASSS